MSVSWRYVQALTEQKRVSEIDSQIASATTSIQAEKAAAEALASSRQEQIDALTTDLEKSRKDVENKHSIGMRWKTRGDGFIADLKTRSETISAHVQTITDLNGKVDSLTQELEGNKTKIAELEAKVADTEKASSAKESTVQRLQSELSKAQSGSGSQATQLSSAPATTASDNSAELVSGQGRLVSVTILMWSGIAPYRTRYSSTAVDSS